MPRRRNRSRRVIGLVVAGVGVLLVAVVAVQWSRSVARESAIDAVLEDIPDVEADGATDLGAVLVASVPVPDDAQEVTVTGVVEGDTLSVAGETEGPVVPAGGSVTVRLLLVDTPNLALDDAAGGEAGATEPDGAASAEDECLAAEAAAFTRALAPEGSTLRLAVDEEAQDESGRTLAYAWLPDGTFLNETVVRNGFGFAVVLPPNDRHLDAVLAAEDLARQELRGIWDVC